MQSDAYVTWTAVVLFCLLNLFQLGLYVWLLITTWRAKDRRFLTLMLTWFGVILFILTTTAALVVNPNNPLMNFGATLFNFATTFANMPLSSIPLVFSKAGLLGASGGVVTIGVISYLFLFLGAYVVREKLLNHE